MKKLIYITAALFTIVSCNEVSDPYGDSDSAGPGQEDFNDTVYNDTTVTKRRIMMEEFTGHKCPNCPEGADIAEQIKYDNPDDFISVAIHNSGSFSRPDTSDPSKPYPSDFQTETGENLRVFYQVSSYPEGLLNRSEINGSVKVGYNVWAQTVTALLADPAYNAPRFKMYLTNIYNSLAGDRSIRIRYKVEALETLPDDYAIAAYLLESHIIAPQKDSRLSDSYVPDYEHNHVLRKGFPNVGQGKTLFSNPQAGDIAETITQAEELSTTIPDEWKPENMEVVVFIYNLSTGEIFAAEEMHLSNQ